MIGGMELAARCRTLADYHGGTDLAERVRSALDIQREQRIVLAQAADELKRLASRVAELERQNCKPEPAGP